MKWHTETCEETHKSGMGGWDGWMGGVLLGVERASLVGCRESERRGVCRYDEL